MNGLSLRRKQSYNITTQEIIARVDLFMESRNLADSSIRKRAIRKVLAFMDSTNSFIKGGQVVLPSNKSIVTNAYERFKGRVLSSAEKSAINHMYEVAGHLRDNTTPSPGTTPVPGLYCIKLRKGVILPTKYGKIREDGIIYIGKADVLRERL